MATAYVTLRNVINERSVNRLMDNALTIARWATTIVVAIWGNVPQLTQLLVMLMVIDIALGVCVAWKQRDLSAKAAWEGMTKKIASLLMIAVAGLLNPFVNGLVEVNLVQAASAFYIVPELLSITRNAAILDVPVFTQFTVVLRYFQAVSQGGTPESHASTEPKKPNDPPVGDS